MNITKKQSLYLGFGIIILFFVSSVLMLNQSTSVVTEQSSQQVDTKQEEQKARFDPAIPVTLNEFHRSETKEGRKVWEVTALTGRYFPQSNSADLEKAKIFVYKKDDSVVELQAEKAKLFLDGASLKQAEVSQGVKVNYDGKLFITTDNASYDHSREEVTAPGLVTLESENMTVTGEDLLAKINTKEFELRQNVSTTVKPRKASKQ